MSNKQAVEVLDKMIEELEIKRWDEKKYDKEKIWLIQKYIRISKYRIQSLPDTDDEWISVEEINRTLDRKKQLHTITKEEHNGKEMNLTYHAWYNLWYLEWYIGAIENILLRHKSICSSEIQHIPKKKYKNS